MRIALVQTAPENGRIEENLKHFDQLIGSGDGSDIYILPEMFSSGQYLDPRPVAESMDGQTVTWMKKTAARIGGAVTGSVAILEDGHYYNRLCFATPQGDLFCYDKHHLFSYSGENLLFTAGKDRVVITYKGLKILLHVCYDLRFPIFTRNRDDYDAIIYVANWPVKRLLAWDTLVRARAIENQCFVFAVNRVGQDQFGDYPGHSFIINPYGQTVCETKEGQEEMVSSEIDLEKLYSFRQKFPVLQDGD